MKRSRMGFVICLAVMLISQFAVADEDGFVSLFDGKSLDGWDGNPKFWSVKDGAISGQTTKDNPTKGNTFLIYRKGEVADFELRLQFRIVGGNSGIQYRSKEHGKWVIGGYQADFDAGGRFSGILYEERGRGILAMRGDKVVISEKGEKGRVGKTTPDAEILKAIKKEDWNDYTVIAKGNHLKHIINGKVTVEVTDNQTKRRAMKGLLALQLHAGPPMLVQFRKIRIKDLGKKKVSAKANGKGKKVVFMAGRPSHGYGSHEHNAGSLLLAKALQAGVDDVKVMVYRNGWPKDPKAFDDADTIVMYCDGGGRHPVNPNLEQIDRLAKKGVGVVCIHYGVEVPKGDSGNKFLEWIGGYFETHWSVNPHWTANFVKLPKHDITRGVKPFEINDEWYYHMRFRDEMRGVTPILTAVPPAHTLKRPDGPHSGNPHVRKKAGQPQHVAWASENVNGGRGFGFTGGHVHWNWGDSNFRKVVLNAICWTAHIDIPSNGIEDHPVGVEDLKANQDFPAPKNFDDKRIRSRISAVPSKKKVSKPVSKPLFSSPVITSKTPGHQVKIDVPLKGARKLFLVVTDGGNGYGCDWANWVEPVVLLKKRQVKLTDLKWKNASAEWGTVRKNRNANGGELRVNGRAVKGIGTHATSVIEFDLPVGSERFQALGGLDEGGTSQGDGNATSVQFHVYTSTPNVAGLTAKPGDSVSRDPKDAVAGLDVGPGLTATLFASEPMIKSLANIDIDHKGRIWACEIVNYRKFRNKSPERKEGDRIVVLEDTNGDQTADKSTVFYQGRDIDSPHGVLVLGNKVIVSSGPHVLVLTDTNGDLKADKKEVLFSGISGTQHDHGIHTFVFGPDGKLYFNFGNSGKQLLDGKGKPITDHAGNVVNASRKPYQEGMVFRCNLDGSELETLGWNFRNNWEIAVDSFGTLWQSDNDDDGNKGVRINFVMEFGNYGYKDEFTGEGWRSPRTGWEATVPERHWHLNDPGVVPNLLQTGAGSPTGLTVYEGTLLPPRFRGQVIHCDAGPNVVRAYPVQKKGAGYIAEIDNILQGARDKWFRPADVCVAPDGSLFVSDWYDPGVGGHAQGDVNRGRLFRVAPPNSRFSVKSVDLNSVKGAIAALANPNQSTRHMAWMYLNGMGRNAEKELAEAFNKASDKRLKARYLWLLGKIDGRGQHWVDQAIKDESPDIRIVGLRLARQLNLEVEKIISSLIYDGAAEVRRECAIALRHCKSPEVAEMWAQLAMQHDGRDRWYLEALGIGADKRWDECLAAYLKHKPTDKKPRHDIIWRSRASQTPALLASLIVDAKAEDAARYFRSFDFQDPGKRTDALFQLAFGRDSEKSTDVAFVRSESLKRLRANQVNSNPEYQKAIARMVKEVQGTQLYVELVDRFDIKTEFANLLELAQSQNDNELGVAAIRALLAKRQVDLIAKSLAGKSREAALKTAIALGNSEDGRSVGLLIPLLLDAKRDSELRRQATRAVSKTANGANRLIQLAKQGKFPQELKESAAFHLNNAAKANIRRDAAKLFPLPAAKNNKPLPPIANLVRQRGEVSRGKALYLKTGECAKCHIVGKEGKEVGPNLSEIGSKLSRQALFESILYPNAGISHNYETYSLALDSGNIVSGIIVSQNADSISLKGADAITRTYKKSEVDEMRKQPTSLMPADLQKNLSTQDLVDIVDFLQTLKKK